MLLLAVGLGFAAALLVAASLLTARRPTEPVPDADGYLERWSALHGGHDPGSNAWLKGWLLLTYRIARPLARRGVQPDVLTAWTVWFACLVFLPAAAGGRWQILAGWILVLSGLGDTMDGCVAALTNRATRFGYVLDSMVDRINDLVYLGAVVLVGGPPELAVACGAGFLLHDYLRARAANAGAGEVSAVTLGERANRVILLAAAIHFGGVFVGQAELVATVGLWAMVAFTAVGFAQLAIAVRRRLAGVPGAPTHPAGSEPPLG